MALLISCHDLKNADILEGTTSLDAAAISTSAFSLD